MFIDRERPNRHPQNSFRSSMQAWLEVLDRIALLKEFSDQISLIRL